MEAAMGPLPDRSKFPALDVRVSERYDGDGFTRLKLSYASERRRSVCRHIFFCHETERGAWHCAIVALHQTTPLGKSEPAGLGGATDLHYALELAKRGYVVLVPDYPSLGEYRYDFSNSKYPSGSMKGIANHMRGIDLLCSREEVDPERIGVIGHSLGGHNAMFLAAFDSRVKAVVSSCGWTSMADYHGGKLGGWAGRAAHMPRLRSIYNLDPNRVPFDFDEVIAAIAPRAFWLSNSPLRDNNFAVNGVRKAESRAREVYKLLGASERVVIRYPDAEHTFPADVRNEAYEFLDCMLSMPSAQHANDRNDVLPATIFPAFDHLGTIGLQAKAAAACGVNLLYATGLGGEGYGGLPEAAEWARRRQAATDFCATPRPAVFVW